MCRRFVPLAIACMAVLVLVACTRYRTPLRPQPEGRRVYQKQKPARLAPHVRPVYRVSDEAAAEGGREQRQVDLADPEINDTRAVAEIDPGAARRLAELLLDRGRELDALEEVRAARQRFPSDLDSMLLEARIWQHLGDAHEALRSALEAVRLDPYSNDAWVAVADSEFARGRRRRAAAEAFLAAIRLGAGEPGELRRAGLLFLETEWWLEARDCLAAAWEQGDRSPETAQGLASAWLRLDGEAAALEVLATVYPPAEAWTRLGKLWMASERWEKAHDSLVKALVLETGGAEARILLQMVDSHLPPPPVVNIPAFSDHSLARIRLPEWTTRQEGVPIVVAGIEATESGEGAGLPPLRWDYRELPAPETAGLILLRSFGLDAAQRPNDAVLEVATPSGVVLEVTGALSAEARRPISVSGWLERLHVTDRLPPLVRDALAGDAERAAWREQSGGTRWLGWGSEPRAVVALSQLSGRTGHPPARLRLLGLQPAFGPGSMNRDEPLEFPALLAVAGLTLVAGMSLSSKVGGVFNRVVGAGLGLLVGCLAVLAMGIWHVV